MKKLGTLMLCLALAGCGTSAATDTKLNVSVHTQAQKSSFIELMETVRDNWHQAPTPELKSKVNQLMLQAGLRQECADKRCWLQYKQYQITTTDEFIVIRSKNLEIKVTVDEPETAAEVIYQ